MFQAMLLLMVQALCQTGMMASIEYSSLFSIPYVMIKSHRIARVDTARVTFGPQVQPICDSRLT
jgi:hypothetical protein